MSIIKLLYRHIVLSKVDRLKAEFLDDSRKVKYYEILKLRIERKDDYKNLMDRLYKIKTGEYDRDKVRNGVCYFIGAWFRDALIHPDIMEGYKFWDKETCSKAFLIDVKDGSSPKLQYCEERYWMENDKFYQARVELAKYWLDVLTYVDNHFH